MQTKDFIKNLITELGISYIDVVCCQNHKEIFRFHVGENVTGKEVLYMYSCGKLLTVSTALQAVEKGLIGLDDPVCKYLPEIRNAFILTDGNEKKIVGEEMTVRHLFTMSAGFTYDLKTPPILAVAEQSGGKAKLRDFIPAFVQTPLSFAPGERFQYSICHDVLAAVVEEAMGCPFSQCVKKGIFDPLGMFHSRFDNGETSVADLYMAWENGEISKIDEGKILLPTPAYESGGGGLVSTVEDYIRFADMLACGGVDKNGTRILQAETIQKMASEQAFGLAVNNGFTCVQGDDYAYGLGVRVRKKPTDWGLDEGEFGWDGAAGSYVMLDPKRKVSIFIGMHLRNWPVVFTGKHLEIVKCIYEEFLNKD